MQQQTQQLWELLKTSQKILLINHIRMDWDAWGSLWWLALVLQSMWKEIKCINDDPVPETLQFLWHNDLVEPDLDVATFDPDLIISLDASDTERLWKSYTKWKTVFDKKDLIVIDHHVSNPAFWDLNIIDAKASSTCEILYQILEDLQLTQHISPEAATFFYTGLQTDTNMYFNPNVRSETLIIWGKLVAHGADFRLPVMECFKKTLPEQIEIIKVAFTNMNETQDGKVRYSTITNEEVAKLWIPREKVWLYLKGFVNDTLINIDWTQIVFLIYPISDTENKISMRSKVPHNVNEIAQKFWGGGHLQAAGFQSHDTHKIIIKQILAEAKRFL